MTITIRIWDRVPRVRVIRVQVMGIGYFAQAYIQDLVRGREGHL
jgi:hypothetical protein